MFIQKFVICLLAILLASILSGGGLLAAPGTPISPGARSCTRSGIVYPHGSLRYSPVLFMGKVVRYDIYRCQDSAWTYLGSSDDVMP